MKGFFTKAIKWFLLLGSSIVLVTVGIDAADHHDNMSESLVGRIVLGKDSGPCPGEMVYISMPDGGFCIDKYEASAGDSCVYSNPATQAETNINLDNSECKPDSRERKIPWRNISQTQAAIACAKAGKRLPTSEEWYFASLGTPDLEQDWGIDDCHVAENWPSQPGETGSGKNCQSANGLFDMIGNAWEWVGTQIVDGKLDGRELPDAGYISAVDIHGVPIDTDNKIADLSFNNDYFWIKNKGVRGMARGGYWNNKSDAGQFSVYLVSPPSFSGVGVGFRCAK